MSNICQPSITHRIQNLIRACLFWAKNLTSNFDPTENKLHNQEYVKIHTYALYGDKKKSSHCALWTEAVWQHHKTHTI